MKIKEVIHELRQLKNDEGFQITKVRGIMTSTWLIYQKSESFYFFNIDDKIEFTDRFKYTEDELISEFGVSEFVIDMPIG